MKIGSRTHPRVIVAFADKVIETDQSLRVRPMGLHPFGGCQNGLVPALLVGAALVLPTWIFGWSWSVPPLGAGYVFLVLLVSYHVWNYRRKKGYHDSIVDKVERRIHIRDSRSRKRVVFGFETIERINEVHSHYLDDVNLIEKIEFSLKNEYQADHVPTTAFIREGARPMSFWLGERIESGFFGDIVADIVGCPIVHNTRHP